MTKPVVTVLVLALVALAGCPELLAGDMKSPDYWADYFLDKYHDELQVDQLEEGPAPLAEPRTVLLVTGVTIRAEWLDLIKRRLERDGFRTVVYEPPELLSGDLFQASRDFGHVVEQVQADSGQDKIDILAECTGGLIARHYIQSLGGDQYVERLVTFVSPQHGVAKAPLAAAIAGWPALYDLSPGSDFLTAVNSVPLPDSLRMTSIYSCTDEYIQPYTTSIVPGAHNIGLCDGFVGHFQTMWDPDIYLIMHDALIEGLPDPSADPSDDPSTDDPSSPDDGDRPQTDDQAMGGGCNAGSTPTSGATLLLIGMALMVLRRRRCA